MRKSVILNAPFPTVEEIAARSGVSKTEMLELVALGNKLYAEEKSAGSRPIAAPPKASKRSVKRPATKKRAT